MSKHQHVLVTNYFHPETVDLLDKKFTAHHLWKLADKEKLDLISSLQGKCKAVATASWVCDEAIYQLNSLQLISCFGVGVDAIDFDKTQEMHVRVTNTPDVLNDSVADISIALILACTRNLVIADNFVRSKKWQAGPLAFGQSIRNKTLGIAGFGRIGEEIAKRAETFGLKIAYHNRNPKDVPFTYHGSITELAAASDILLCMLPGGEDTKHAIDAQVLRELGPTGTFINVGRGSSVDEDALVLALQQRQIHAAGLDVYADEPNVPEALLAMDNVVLLPHIGSATVETRRAMGQLVIDNLEAFFADKPLITEVL